MDGNALLPSPVYKGDLRTNAPAISGTMRSRSTLYTKSFTAVAIGAVYAAVVPLAPNAPPNPSALNHANIPVKVRNTAPQSIHLKKPPFEEKLVPPSSLSW